jgi:hypothetical protein
MARQTITECDRKLARYRTALEALDDDTDPALIAGWITDTQTQRAAAETQLRQTPRPTHMTQQQITDLINELGDTATALTTAAPTGKADLYGKLGLHLTYHPGKQTVRAEARLDPHRIGRRFVSEAGVEPISHHRHPSRTYPPRRCRPGRRIGGVRDHGESSSGLGGPGDPVDDDSQRGGVGRDRGGVVVQAHVHSGPAVRRDVVDVNSVAGLGRRDDRRIVYDVAC